MKITIYLSFLYLSTASCHHSSDSENQRNDENLITSGEHSRADYQEYDAFEGEARRKFEARKGRVSEYKRIPAVRRVVPGEDDVHESEHKKGSHNHSHEDDDRESNRSNLSDNESDHVDYEPEEYPLHAIRPSSAPPSIVFVGSQPVGRRQVRLPVYRRPSYTRVFDVAPLPVSYRTLNPVTYSVPRVRNVVLGYPSLNGAVRYAYGSQNAAYGVLPDEYRGFIAEEYDDFLKKK